MVAHHRRAAHARSRPPAGSAHDAADPSGGSAERRPGRRPAAIQHHALRGRPRAVDGGGRKLDGKAIAAGKCRRRWVRQGLKATTHI
ncbi:hypothetical protein G6F57_022802 [Rhizopus arrhizus]|nr:hypothetical protein G6F57_022802 [Rhizopus arrhizus]